MIYDLILWFNHAMDQTQILEDDNITKSPIFCDEGKFWISYLVKQLNEEHKLMFDDIIYIGKTIVPWYTINLFIFDKGWWNC
jgi:hypothetical protein